MCALDEEQWQDRCSAVATTIRMVILVPSSSTSWSRTASFLSLWAYFAQCSSPSFTSCLLRRSPSTRRSPRPSPSRSQVLETCRCWPPPLLLALRDRRCSPHRSHHQLHHVQSQPQSNWRCRQRNKLPSMDRRLRLRSLRCQQLLAPWT